MADKIKGVEKNSPNLPPSYEVPEVWQEPAGTGGTFGSINRPTAGSRSVEELPRGKNDIQLYSLGTPNGVKVIINIYHIVISYQFQKYSTAVTGVIFVLS